MYKNVKNFSYEEGIKSLVTRKFKRYLYLWLTRSSPNMFLRSSDTISIDPQISGVYEPAITSFINHLSSLGYSDFLVDIGANIGLTSCQNGSSFKYVEMYEPNPNCHAVLGVNISQNLTNTEYKINNFGLGESRGVVLLKVPRHNWGGAFIDDIGNAYTRDMLLEKDSFSDYVDDNYQEVKIEIRNARLEFEELFLRMASRGFAAGVIKLDVEGYEVTILRALAQSIPKEFDLAIVFESWSPSLDFEKIVNLFNGRANGYKLKRATPWKGGAGLIAKFVSLLCRPVKRVLVTPAENDCAGDMVLIIKGRN